MNFGLIYLQAKRAQSEFYPALFHFKSKHYAPDIRESKRHYYVQGQGEPNK